MSRAQRPSRTPSRHEPYPPPTPAAETARPRRLTGALPTRSRCPSRSTFAAFYFLVRVLYYLDDLTEVRAPFRLIPRSHLSFHGQASPYARYKSHPEEITLTASAGTAVIVPSMLIHGSHPNRDSHSRSLVQLGYRPAWAGPIQPVDEWDPDLVAAAPEIAKPFLQSLNRSDAEWVQPNKPAGMKSEAPGINPSRWG